MFPISKGRNKQAKIKVPSNMKEINVHIVFLSNVVLSLFSLSIPLICCCLRQQWSNMQAEIKGPIFLKKIMFICFLNTWWFNLYSAWILQFITRFAQTKEELDKQLSNSTNFIKEHCAPFCGCATTCSYTLDFLHT